MATGPQIEKLDLPVCAPPRREKVDDLLDTTERAYLVDALSKTRESCVEAAKLAGLSLKPSNER